MKVVPRTLPGFMELMPKEMVLFNKIKSVIEKSYQKYGFLPLDTPVIEYANVLLAKAGGETEKQIYRFMKGDNDLSLRFDLTVPLAKYVSMHCNELVFPFKRYQIGKVFRGERPQKGRFREFYQCDIDVIGQDELSLNYDVEMPLVIYEIFSKLKIGKFVIRINNRKILNGLFNYLKIDAKEECLRIVDKLEKVSRDSIFQELLNIGLTEEKINYLLNFMNISGSNTEILKQLSTFAIDDNIYKEGIKEIEYLCNNLIKVIPENYFKIDLTIARGLDYYTGTVYETTLIDYPSYGSICSGGRYDNLAEFYTDKKLPGVGISIGLTRLFSFLLSKNIISVDEGFAKTVLIIPMEDTTEYSLEVASILREHNIGTNVCYLNKGMKQKFKYADHLKAKYVIILGENEEKDRVVTLKNMTTGEQKTIDINECISILING